VGLEMSHFLVEARGSGLTMPWILSTPASVALGKPTASFDIRRNIRSEPREPVSCILDSTMSCFPGLVALFHEER
jgi:hypothetical protein